MARATSDTQTAVLAGGATGPLAFGLLVSAGCYQLARSVAGRRLLLAARAQ